MSHAETLPTSSAIARRVVRVLLVLAAVGLGILIGAGSAFGQQGRGATAHPAAATGADVFDSTQVEQPPERLWMPPVRFPTQALRRGVDGAVTVQFVVSETGHVETQSVAVVAATSEAFAAAAREAVVQAVFRPGRMQGRAVRSRVQQTIRFAQPGSR